MKRKTLSEKILHIKKNRDGKNQKLKVLKLAFSRKKGELAQFMAFRSENRTVDTSA